jgi:hypothetical protein
MTIFGASSLHPKIPFPAAVVERQVRTQLKPYSGCAAVIRDPGSALQLFRIESERLKLPAPFSGRIAEPLDADAAGQATFYGCFDKIGREEGERNHHIDLPNAALLTGAELCDGGYATRDNVIQPPATSGDGADQARPTLELFRTYVASRCIVRDQDLAESFGWRFPPGDRERVVIRGIGCFVCVI